MTEETGNGTVGIKVGNDEGTFVQVSDVILEILRSGQDQKTIRCALEALSGTLPAPVAHISACNFNVGSDSVAVETS